MSGTDTNPEKTEAILKESVGEELLEEGGYSFCDGCFTVGSFWDENFTSLFAQDFDTKVYCSDCVPEWWEEKLDA
jgi:hypothetical protein|tara:strand:+ start:333 stop:557 length:225 start_codon:yes stop_codon:yes gene_type:complete